MMSSVLRIKSSIKNYELEFVSSGQSALSELLQPEDILLIDQRVAELFPEMQGNDKTRMFSIESSESEKEYIQLARLIEQILKLGVSKRTRMIGVGGGVVQDISGFIASILLRGINWYFFPTNLLTQCDSCIGSKTSINFMDYKNQLGGFYPPSKIYVDFNFLTTLPELEIRSGLGEILHYVLVDGKESTQFFQARLKKALEGGEALQELIRKSLAIKAKMIEVDEFDRGPRNVFNYGHTFGHALESATHYKIPHGIAVGMGINLANELSYKQGYVAQDFVREVQIILSQILPQNIVPSFEVAQYMDALKRDKKNIPGFLCPILTQGYGKMFKDKLLFDEGLSNFIERYFKKISVHELKSAAL